jgi:hypothetical protein
MWSNLAKNVRNWAKGQHIPEHLLAMSTEWWFLVVGALLSAIVVAALIRHRRGTLPLLPADAFGRTQLLFLIIIWVQIVGAIMQAFPAMATKGVFFVHTTFWITGGICSIIVLALSGEPDPRPDSQLPASDRFWKPGMKYWLSWSLIPILVFLLAYLTVASHDEPLFGSHLRFVKTSQP